MNSFSFKLIFLTIFLCFHQAYGGEDKGEKSVKSSDSKSKLAKSQVSTHRDIFSESYDNDSISELGISVPPEYANDTVQYDHHTYYNSTFYTDPEVAKQYWIDINSYPTVTVHEMLSNSHRQATTVDIGFDFPFYGSYLQNVTIATGGFLYMGDYLHNWIAATQYIAPLMANFDTSQSADSSIKYAHNDTAFTVEWEKVFIKNRMKDGAFTFQVNLFKSGDILFAYKEVPYPVTNISDSSHPVKIGISDAYILERSLFFLRRKTIYEYHRIDMLKKNIDNNTALYFTALPTCLTYKDCSSCLAADPKLECMWCESVKRCSDGVDRQRQNWITNHCSIQAAHTCPEPEHVPSSTTGKPPVTTPSNKDVSSKAANQGDATTIKYSENYPEHEHESFDNTNHLLPNSAQEAAHYVQESGGVVESSVSIGAIVTIVIFIVALLGAGVWMGYAYKFPQSSSGQFLIKYRPSQWNLRKEDNTAITNSRHL